MGSKGGAPFGNKNALGCTTSGRPKQLDPIEWADKLLKWAEKQDSFALCEFCAENNTHHQRIYYLKDTSVEFAEAFQITKYKLAARLRKQLHDKENPYCYGLFMREIGSHDKFLYDYENEEKDKDAARRAKQEPEASPQILVAHESLMNSLAELQSRKQ